MYGRRKCKFCLIHQGFKSESSSIFNGDDIKINQIDLEMMKFAPINSYELLFYQHCGITLKIVEKCSHYANHIQS